MDCKICKKPILGRVDKIFCSVACKNEYHVKLRRVNKAATLKIDIILHRNRSILLEVMGKNAKQKKVTRMVLDRKKFNFNYITGFYINSKGKTYHYVYDFAWMLFSDSEVMIVRKNSDTSK
ncbi:MAG: hypothetical protein R2730_14130 [Chitinophagales bacterium]